MGYASSSEFVTRTIVRNHRDGCLKLRASPSLRVEAMGQCSKPSASPAYERVIQLAEGLHVLQSTHETVNRENVVHERKQRQH
jgi:hypothetical protein